MEHSCRTCPHRNWEKEPKYCRQCEEQKAGAPLTFDHKVAAPSQTFLPCITEAEYQQSKA